MTKRMLIDSTHAEETRIVVLDGSRLEDFDVETSTKKQLKGNIYLAKVVRVEPSLQAAFVEYGGNRHGFLAFGEIHPDYYQIPVADRQRLLEAQAEEARAEEEAEDREAAAEAARPATAAEPADPAEPADAVASDVLPSDLPHGEPVAQADAALEAELQERDAPVIDTPPPETLGGTEQDVAEEARDRRPPPRFLRNYKIQEVIRRRQILLIQVVKEERGTKGAALTTYLSLAGRFSVLMPNSPRGGGISRKITSAADRKRLKDITAELDIPPGMGLIVRTAGANRPKPEIKRDCEYLLRLWDDIRDHTMRSIAPALIYEEASLIKRAIRDVYARDVDEILVDGEPGWHAARDFMRMLMPSHARKVQLWTEGTPLFARYQVDAQLDAMLLPTVQLKSGGYLVINQAEALVAIDVNSGRSTRERGIEETALRTNLEAADEVARQLRLRDLAGLIVIDFIDMDAKKHNAMVERRLKDALKTDRARIQVGHISHFGLMEMSRQRLRPSLAETSFITCPHCGGVGHVRSTESAAIHVLRAIEEEGAKRRAAEIVVHVATGIAMYILNHKRDRIGAIETRYAMHVAFAGDETLLPPNVRIERLRAQVVSDLPAAITPDAPAPLPAPHAIALEPVPEDEDVVEADAVLDPEAGTSDVVPGETAEEGERRRKRRRRRRRGGRREDGTEGAESSESSDSAAADGEEGEAMLPDAPSGGAGDGAVVPEMSPLPAPEPPVAELPEPIVPDAPVFAAGIEAELTGQPAQTAPEPETPAPETPAPATAASGSLIAEAGDAEASVAPPAPVPATVEEAVSEDPQARRRGRRGGRRRRVVEDPDAPPPPLDAPQPPIYTGPTPADPFAGQTFDIFDVIEQAERQTAPRGRAKAQIIAEIEPPAIAAETAPGAEDSVPAAVELASAPIVEPEPELHQVATIEPEPAAPAAADAPEPLVRPILVDAEAPAGERKRGWWRR